MLEEEFVLGMSQTEKKRGIKDLYAVKANTMTKRYAEIENEVKKVDGTPPPIPSNNRTL